MRILAIDVGDKKIGLAVGERTTGLAFARPALLVASWADAWDPILTLVNSEQIGQIIVGWPVNADGSAGAQSERVQQFIDQLKTRTAVPIEIRDERHTSQAVQREQRQAGRKLSRGEEDSLAAQLLLETYLSERP